MTEIKQRILPVNPFSRPGSLRAETLGVVFHWTAAPGQKNDQTARYFELLANQDEWDGKPDRFASAHAIIGMDGEILQVLPWDEVGYHVGAKDYTDHARRAMSGYTTNKSRGTPNWCTVGIELCHPDMTGEFTSETIGSAIWLGGYLSKRYHLGRKDVMRHYDITGKRCPRYFVDRLDEFMRLRKLINAETQKQRGE